MTRTLLIPDVHGDREAALRLLRSAGALNEHGERVLGFNVVSLGDLIHGHLYSRAADAAALSLLDEGLIDTLLVGNHEYPFLGGIAFDGFEPSEDFTARLLTLYAQGRLKVALAIGDKLITHAGLTPKARNEHGWDTAYEAAADLNALFATDTHNKIFSQIGYARGGWHATGGILWSDFNDEARWLGFNQIHGHTPSGVDIKRSPTNGNWALLLDNKGGKGQDRLAGAIVEGTDVTIIYGDGPTPEFLPYTLWEDDPRVIAA